MAGYFEAGNGDKSSSRLTGFIVIVCALIFAQEVIYFGRKDIVNAAIAAGTIFVTVAGSAMFFLFGQKKTEVQQEEKKQEMELKSEELKKE